MLLCLMEGGKADEARPLVGASNNLVIQDDAISASSWWNEDFAPAKVRMDSSHGWCRKKNAPLGEKSWVQFDLGGPKVVRKIRTRGDGINGCISKYQLSLSMDGNNWSQRIALDGNTDSMSIKEVEVGFVAQVVRFIPIEECPGPYGLACLHVEFFGHGRTPASHSKRMLDTMWLDGEFADCKVVCAEREFSCHRAVLGTASSVWYAALKGGFRESHDAKIVIEETSASSVEALLTYIYTGKLEESHSVASGVLPLAHRYDLPDLIAICTQILVLKVTVDTVGDTLSLVNMFIDHECVAAQWNSLQEKVHNDPAMLQEVMRNVRKKVA